jgi:thymidylate synthase (FAD)
VTFRFVLEGISEDVCRQLYKHQVGCGFTSGHFRESATVWNEMSGRYVEFDPEFVIPSHFRRQHPNNRQASLEGELVESPEDVKTLFVESVNSSYETYQNLLKAGVCKEQARMVLPICFKNSLVWTASLEAVGHFIHLRKHEGAQVEIRYLAETIEKLVQPFVPESLKALLGQEMHQSSEIHP